MSEARRFLQRLHNPVSIGLCRSRSSTAKCPHLALLEDEFIRPGDARRTRQPSAARRRFGGVDQTKEQHA